jgi:predicted membrane channel-forming protein YqfA (hemolysin III family)
LLILGSQILLGFQFHGVFQEAFDRFPPMARELTAAGILLMVAAVALLIAPSLQHQIVERGHATSRIRRVIGIMAGLALLPFALSLALAHLTVFQWLFGSATGYVCGAVFFVLAITFWYGLEWWLKQRIKGKPQTGDQEQVMRPPLSTRIDHILTEARVVLPGAQALLGFQLTVALTRPFEQLPGSSKIVHAAALASVALSVILLMAPAAFHRIAFNGEDSETFHRIGSGFVVSATVPLAVGIAGDLYVAGAKIAGSPSVGLTLALAALIVLSGLWYAYPYLMRRRHRRRTAT